jgi:hypothetical protein
MDETTRQNQVRWLVCFACGEPFEMVGQEALCPCGRSAARLEAGVVEVEGPAKVLAPIETVIKAEGGEWAPVPDDIVIRRVVPDGV